MQNNQLMQIAEKVSALTVNLETILAKVKQVYSKDHTIVFNTDGTCGIEDSGNCKLNKNNQYVADVEIEFPTLQDLYFWTLRSE